MSAKGRVIAERKQLGSGEMSWSADEAHHDVKVTLQGAGELLKGGGKA